MIARPNPLVLDADALNHIAADTALQEAMDQRAQQGLFTVLTPHPLEAARLLGTTAAAVQADRLQAARGLSTRWNAVAVLKGSGTVVVAPPAELTVNGSGNAWLATAGTGDVLAGMVGAALARLGADAAAVRQAVYAHGLLADRWPAQTALTASRLAGACRPLAPPEKFSPAASGRPAAAR